MSFVVYVSGSCVCVCVCVYLVIIFKKFQQCDVIALIVIRPVKSSSTSIAQVPFAVRVIDFN